MTAPASSIRNSIRMGRRARSARARHAATSFSPLAEYFSMRFIRLLGLVGAAAALGACSSDKLTNANFPPLAGVRFINAVPDTFNVDLRAMDQVEWSPEANNVAFRGYTHHQPIEAKNRHFRVFTQPGDKNASPNNVSQVLADSTFTFEANKRYTLLLTGSARAGTVRFVLINDDLPSFDTTEVALRALNANGAGAVDVYLAGVAAEALPPSPAFANVAANGASSYVTRATGDAHLRAYGAGDRATALAVAAAPAGVMPDPGSGLRPPAGVRIGGTAYSVVYFPASVAGSPAQQFAAPGVVFMIDRNPGETRGPR